jgi:Putative porin
VLRICYILPGVILLLMGFVYTSNAQNDPFRRLGGIGRGAGGGAQKQGGKGDSSGVQHRTGLEDSITIRLRYLDSSRLQQFDSSLSDFTKKVPLPWTQVHLGNLGNASRSIVFSPIMKPGWDHGFHAYDVYNYTLAEARFFNTTRPYTQLDYLLGSRAEQFIHMLHTQNIRPNWNMAMEYRFTNSPGYFQNQSTNHNNYRFTSWYQSKNKRYQNFIAIVGNKLQSGENGGIKTDLNYLDSVGAYDERTNIPTQLGPDDFGSRNPFSSSITTGTFFTNATYLMRQQYDLGQKDSVVTDSTVIPLFYPRLRMEHTISYNTYKYRFKDFDADSAYYDSKYAIKFPTATGDSFFIQDFWKELVNDFSLYTFPDAKNSQQFLKAGGTLQTLQGSFDSGRVSRSLYNFFVHGEYRNMTRNKKWDIEASGQFYINGINSGDYHAYASLKRLISPKIGYLQLGFENTSRTPSFVFDPTSSFYLGLPTNFKKENIVSFFGSVERVRFKLSAAYYLVTNYTFIKNLYEPDQFTTPFNLLSISLEKQFIIHGGLNLKTSIVVQQRIGDGPVNVPFISTRNQLGYDGSLGLKNLRISFGLEMRYFTSYKAPDYSPLIGQYSFQDTTNIRMKLPDLTGYLHFRIRTFTAYVRTENLNSINFTTGKFTNNNVPTRNYPYPGLQIRVGIFWNFVN